MSWKKTLLWVILFTLVIGLFEVAFLYDFKGNTEELTETVPQQPVWFLLVLHALIMLPCFVLGYGRANAVFGFIPPVLLNSVYWIILALKMKKTLAHLDLTLFPHFYYLVIGTSFLAGFFGIVVVIVTKKMMEAIEEANLGKEAKNQELLKEGDNQLEVNGKSDGLAKDKINIDNPDTSNKEKQNPHNGSNSEKPVIEGNIPLQEIDSSVEKSDNIKKESE